MKNIMYAIITALAVLSSACNKDSTEGFVHSAELYLTVKNNEGKDLLDPNNPESFKEEDIHLLYIVDGKAQKVYDENMTIPKGFKIVKLDSEYSIKLFLNSDPSEKNPITYIQWDDNSIDTLKAEYRRNGSVICTKVWFNDEIRWDSSVENTIRSFEIVK